MQDSTLLSHPDRPTVYSVVIPVFNSAVALNELTDRIRNVFCAFQSNYEIILVEDSGEESSWQAIQRLVGVDEKIRGFRLARNYGQHNALLCGIRAARGDIIVTMDDDLQNPPEEMPRLLAKLDEGYDVVYGTPQKETHGILRDMASRITKLALRGSMGAQAAATISAFRAFRTNIRVSFQDYRSPNVNIDVLLTWGTTRFASIKVRQDRRSHGQSGYTLPKLARHTFNMLTGFSVLPLQVASLLGLIFSLFGLFILAYVLLMYLIQGSSVAGFTFISSIISIFSGVQLFSIGVIGEYLARIHFRTMDRPPYIVTEEAERDSVPLQHPLNRAAEDQMGS